MPSLYDRVVVLNSAWTPIAQTNVRDAFVMMARGRAKAVCRDTYETYTFEDWLELEHQDRKYVRTPRLYVRVPQVILLVDYARIPPVTRPFTRRGIYERDGYKCQYCGKSPGRQKLSIDHVMPSSRGGRSTWENCVVACKFCNEHKGNRTPEEANMALSRKPYSPLGRMVQDDIWKSS